MSNKEKKQSQFKKILVGIKRMSDQSKEEKDRKKKEKLVSGKPKGYAARKIGVLSFWTLFAFMFLVVFATMFSNSSKGSVDIEKLIEDQESIVTSQEAVSFGKSFSRDYFTWTADREGIVDRRERLKPYLAGHIVADAGLSTGSLEQDSIVRDISLRKIDEVNDDIAMITYLVKYELQQKELSEKKVLESKQAEHFFVVPVAFDGQTFGVYELPKFTYVEEETTVGDVSLAGLDRVENAVASRVDDFLYTFFPSFASDPQENLNYLLKSDDVTNGLKGDLAFVDVKSSDVRQKGENGDLFVFAEVAFEDEETGLSYTTDYELSIAENDGRFVVSGIDSLDSKKVRSKEEVSEASKTNNETENTGDASESESNTDNDSNETEETKDDEQ
ncbi:conjugal transfer protein [Halobacillus locisalis]|uniref:Conjugal transfer protein n=1 Tax=Halobacillus locisalis TaxID=220753 RepID=A0A838CYR3_9BACI|nr:conjugal transfer protein [Halobacillus locisalis]MBA2176889.1 conjugal transfer protein [Halobacillus locisalis]